MAIKITYKNKSLTFNQLQIGDVFKLTRVDTKHLYLKVKDNSLTNATNLTTKEHCKVYDSCPVEKFNNVEIIVG